MSGGGQEPLGRSLRLELSLDPRFPVPSLRPQAGSKLSVIMQVLYHGHPLPTLDSLLKWPSLLSLSLRIVHCWRCGTPVPH